MTATLPNDPACVQLHDITLAPVRSPKGPFGRHFFGAFDKTGQFIKDFAHPWCGVDEVPGAPIARLQAKAVYGGVAMHHVGHFILEGLSRLWFMRRHPELPIIWHWIDLPIPHPDDRGWQRELITLLGLGKHRHIFLRQPLFVEHLILPSQGFVRVSFCTHRKGLPWAASLVLQQYRDGAYGSHAVRCRINSAAWWAKIRLRRFFPPKAGPSYIPNGKACDVAQSFSMKPRSFRASSDLRSIRCYFMRRRGRGCVRLSAPAFRLMITGWSRKPNSLSFSRLSLR